uniref:Uncharacterized protein n=1 Tax=viral metagenome TaxID=1070528 RepID=A0A6M3LVC7_9ZZZZ
MAKDEFSWFGNGKQSKDNIIKQTGSGIVKVGTIVGAGILVGMGFSAFKDASESY